MKRQNKKQAFTLIGPKDHDQSARTGRERLHKSGFTLIELIVVMAVIGILVLLAAPKFLGYTQRAQETKHIHTAKVIETALEAYLINGGTFPADLEVVNKTLLEEAADNKTLIGVSGYVATLDEEVYYELTYDFIQKIDVKISADASNSDFLIEALAENVPNAIYSSEKGITLIDKTKALKGYIGGSHPVSEGSNTEEAKEGEVVAVKKEYGYGPIIFSGMGEAAYDNNPATYVTGEGTIAWTGDLTHREIVVNAGSGANGSTSDYFYYYLEFRNDSNTAIPAVGKTTTKTLIAHRYDFTTTKLIVPEGATKIYVYRLHSNYNNNIKLYDISVSDSDMRPTSVNVDFEPTTSSMKMTWDTVNKAIIYRDGVLLGTVTGQTYTDTPLYSDKEYNYDVVFMDDIGNGQKMSYFTKTGFHIAAFSGMGPEAFDNNPATYVTGEGTITWKGDLTHREIEVNAGSGANGSTSEYFYYYLEFRDDSNTALPAAGKTATKNLIAHRYDFTTTKLIVPEGATKIYVYRLHNNYNNNIKLYDITIIN